MVKIFSNQAFEISTNFGTSVVEGNLTSLPQGPGELLQFSFNQLQNIYKTVYIQITPVSGQTADFWDILWSNKVGGEPADQFALSKFVNASGGKFQIQINSDRYAEQKVETFSIRVYASSLDAVNGNAPLAQTTFTIVDDDRAQFSSPGAAVSANFDPANGWTSQDKFARHIADVNGDGYADIVGFGAAGVLVSNGSANGTFSGAGLVAANFGQDSGWTSDNQFHRELADVNGDGRADIIGFGYAGTLVSLAKADGSFTGASTGLADFGFNQGWANQNGFARTVGDVNGDGNADLIGFGYAGTLVAIGNGDGTFQPVKTAISNFGVDQGWTSDDQFHREAADVNGDGKTDIVGFGIAGTYVALSNGDGTFAGAQLVLQNFGANQGWTSNDSFSRHVIDVNGDNMADVVGFGAAGTSIAYGTSDGAFSAVVFDLADFGKAQGWTSDNTFHREIADINNDGFADIVGFGISGLIIASNNGDLLV